MDDQSDAMRIVAVSIGSTNTAFASCDGSDVGGVSTLPSSDAAALAEAIGTRVTAVNGQQVEPARAVVVASVNEPAKASLLPHLVAKLPVDVFSIGTDLGIPMKHTLEDEAIERTGQDRLLAAYAAYDAVKQACVVVDAGTAITVDFVDGAGTYQGGAIAPGLQMQLRALREGTTSLPEVELREPAGDFGANTEEAMLHGVVQGARGLVRLLTERYAIAYDGYPTVVATGGDAELLFGADELIDRVWPGLVLRGIALAANKALEDAGA